MPVPVALFAYKRPNHTKLALDTLARNTLSEGTDLVVFSDGPRGEQDAAEVAAVRELARAASGFASVTLIERPVNMGLARSVIAGVTEILEEHNSIIVLEDDLLTSQYFLVYMNDALSYYQDDAMAFSVTGHTFPAPVLPIPRDYPFDTYAGYRCSSWSWGTWRDRWQRIEWGMGNFPAFERDASAQQAFSRGGRDMTRQLRLQFEGTIDSWAIRFCYAHHINNMRCIYPTRTLVRNIGLDSSGTHSKPDPRFEHPLLDEDWLPRRFCSASAIDERIMRRFRAVFDPPRQSVSRLLLHKTKRLAHRLAQSSRRIVRRVTRLIFPEVLPVDVLVVNTYQKSGGAALAAWRTFCGIRRSYSAATYLTLYRDDWDPGVAGLSYTSLRAAIARELGALDQRSLRRYRGRPATFFTPAIHANPLRIRLSRFRPKLAHLHWVGRGLTRVEEIGKLDCPVVWTLHDTWAFTGGCHYPGDCTGFRGECGSCPQLGSRDDNDISRTLMQRKARTFRDLDLTIVTPSRWMADLAASSSLLSGRRIEVIPNGLDTEAFKPIDYQAARDYLGIANRHPVILFGANRLPDPRKGGDLLCKALSMLGTPYTLLTFGEGELPLADATNVELRSLGSLNDDASLALAYSAADVFACPSREDNLPNTVAEAMACGTPCAAFAVNGLPDMITQRVTGWLAPAFDPSELAAGIRWLANHPHPEELRQAARNKALSEYSLEVMTSRYEALYAELLREGTQ